MRARSFPAVMLRAADGIIRWEYAFVYRAGLADQTGSLELGFRDKTDDFAHGVLQDWKNIPPTVGFKSQSWKTHSDHKNLFLDGWHPVKNPPPFGDTGEKSVSVGCRFQCRRREAGGPGWVSMTVFLRVVIGNQLAMGVSAVRLPGSGCAEPSHWEHANEHTISF